jgi:hypothetical protein
VWLFKDAEVIGRRRRRWFVLHRGSREFAYYDMAFIPPRTARKKVSVCMCVCVCVCVCMCVCVCRLRARSNMYRCSCAHVHAHPQHALGDRVQLNNKHHCCCCCSSPAPVWVIQGAIDLNNITGVSSSGNCLEISVAKGRRAYVAPTLRTMMSCLSCDTRLPSLHRTVLHF